MAEHCLLLPDEMYVGRWYKLFACPVKAAGIPAYTYEVSGPATFKADAVYITGTGELSVTATSEEDGDSCTMTIPCLEYPQIERALLKYTYTTWAQLKEDLEGLTEPTLVRFVEDADIVADTDSTIVPATGCVLDFNNKKISIGTNDVSQKLFCFMNDYCGVRNLYLESTFPDWSTHTTSDKYLQMSTLFQILGGFFELENFVACNEQNYGIGIGTWGHMLGYSYSYAQIWTASNLANGKIESDGSISESDEWWYSPTAIPLCLGRENRFCVGWLDHFLKGSYKTFSFALYDEDDNYIGGVDNAQFYRSYVAPENAVNIRLNVCCDDEPTNFTGDDRAYIMRIYPSNGTREILLKNMRSMSNESGMVDVVGEVSEMNIIECKCANGATNAWAFDFEDGWMSMIDVVMKSCYIPGTLPLHSVQGFALINSVIHTLNAKSWTANDYFETSAIVSLTFNTSQYRGVYKINNCTLFSEPSYDWVQVTNTNLLDTQVKRAKFLTTVFGATSGW